MNCMEMERVTEDVLKDYGMVVAREQLKAFDSQGTSLFEMMFEIRFANFEPVANMSLVGWGTKSGSCLCSCQASTRGFQASHPLLLIASVDESWRHLFLIQCGPWRCNRGDREVYERRGECRPLGVLAAQLQRIA